MGRLYCTPRLFAWHNFYISIVLPITKNNTHETIDNRKQSQKLFDVPFFLFYPGYFDGAGQYKHQLFYYKDNDNYFYMVYAAMDMGRGSGLIINYNYCANAGQ